MTYFPQEERTRRFYEWEKRGRGILVWDDPVYPEPPFSIFQPYGDESISYDDNVSDSLLVSLTKKLFGSTSSETQLRQAKVENKVWNPAKDIRKYSLVELELIPLPGKDLHLDNFEKCLITFSSKFPITFEIIATHEAIKYILTVQQSDADIITKQFKAFLPDVHIRPLDLYLVCLFEESQGTTHLFEYALHEEFMRPMGTLESMKRISDPLTSFLAVVDDLVPEEVVALQVIFQPVRHSWAQQMVQSVSVGNESFFLNEPDMHKIAKAKAAHPLFSVVPRASITCQTQDRFLYICRGLDALLQSTESPFNRLILLDEEELDEGDILLDEVNELLGEKTLGHRICEEILYRKSRRSGMILNSKELLLLVHPPFPSLSLTKLKKHIGKTKKVAEDALGHPFVLGTNRHQGEATEVSLRTAHRLRHTHIIGATGTGKSTLLERMIVQDMEQGNGCMLLDPHGDLVESALSRVPSHRLQDVVIIDPGDMEYSTGFNLFTAHTPIEKIILSSDLVALFRRLSSSWGDQMNSVLANAIHALLDGQGGTILDLRRFLVEKKFRTSYLTSVKDSSIVYYWENEFPMLRRNSAAPIITRLDAFLRPSIIRNMMGQQQGVDIARLVEEKKIILIKLSQGLIGKENSYLLGSLFVAKLNQVIKARQAKDKSTRSPFYLYIDEFQNFITPSMEDILSGARKYGLGLILAHQGLTQLAQADRGVHDSVIANAGNRIVFRVGYSDAKVLEKDFSYFEDQDLQNLSIGEAIVRIGRREHDCNISTAILPAIPEDQAIQTREQAIEYSHKKYSKQHAIVEKEIEEAYFGNQKNKPQIEPSPKEDTTSSSLAPDSEQTDHSNIDGEVKDIEQEANAFKEEFSKRESTKQHIYLQTLLKKMAESRGFKAIIEEEIPEKKGRVDVGLTNENLRIAIEISVTTPAHHEVNNILKCLTAGYDQVLSVSSELNQLNKIRELCNESLSETELEKVLFLDSEAVVGFFDALVEEQAPKHNVVKGYRVKVNYPKSNPNNTQNTQAVSKVILDAIRRLKKHDTN